MRLAEEKWDLAKLVCTEKQLEALTLWHAGYGIRKVALVLMIHRTSARERIEGALGRLGLSLEDFRA